MKNIFFKCLMFTAILLPVIIISGCTVTKKVAISMNSGFTPKSVDEILVLPVVDLRFDKTKMPDMEKVDNWMLNNVEGTLKRYGYKVSIMPNRALVSNITEGDLSSAAWVKQAVPSKSNWILVVGLMDSESKITFGSTGSAEVTGYFYNKIDGTIIWHDKGVGKVGQGGLIGMAMKATMKHDAVIMATGNLMASFPEIPKK
jgi:hypothetical protein